MASLATRAASSLNTLATVWVFLLAFVILADVIGRGFFNAPLQGTKEIVANSIAAIVFLQFPLAIQKGALLRSTFLVERLPGLVQRLIDGIGYLLGAALFAAMALGGWDDMIIGWQIGEIEGEGAFRVPVYPVRTVIVVLSAIGAILFLMLLVGLFLRRSGGDEREDAS